MSRPSTIATYKLFATTAIRRLLNRSTSMKFGQWLKKKGDDGTTAEAVRGATRHRSDQASLRARIGRMFFPLMALCGLVMLSFTSLFTLLGSINLDEARNAAVIHISEESYGRLQKATHLGNLDEREAEINETLKSAMSESASWLTEAGTQLAKERFAAHGAEGFSATKEDPKFRGTMAYLTPAGRQQGLRALGLYLALINLALFSAAFGLMGKNLAGADPSLVWLWQFPVSRRVLFSSKLIEYVFDNPTVPIAALFYSAVLWLFGASFVRGLGMGLLFGSAAGVTSAAVRLALESIITQQLSRRARGAIVAFFAAFGSLLMLVAMTASNAQFLVQGFIRLANFLPGCFGWNPFTAGIGTDAMASGAAGWWLVAPAVAMGFAVLSVLLAVQLTARGLVCAHDSARSSHRALTSVPQGRARFGVSVWKELLQIRRQPEFAAQVLATPIGIGLMLYVAGYQKVMDYATKGGANISTAILVGCSYMLMIAATQMLTSEFKMLWLLQCQPRPLADIVRSKSRVWAAVAIAVSVPFVLGAMAFMPSAFWSILIRAPFLWITLWLIAELMFELTALSATITNEQTVRFQRTILLPALVVSHASLAIYSDNWWAQLGALITLIILNIAVHERALVELSWLSEPVENPPKRVYPMHAILALIGFQSLMSGIRGGLSNVAGISSTANVAISYVAAAIVVTAFCWIWMYRADLVVMPKLPQRPVLRPIVWGLATSCATGLAVQMFLRFYSATPPLAAYATPGNLAHADYDRWCLLGMWVIAAPLFEEWIIRGMLYRSLRRSWGIAVSVALSAVLFATLHPAAGCISLLVLGVMTALATERTNRLWPSMIVHAGYNFTIWMVCVL
ncbi:MAG TPA: CPBP family intramembrane glutamic endopeptidase [Lacipirellulaceae bacterium]|jgi:hypothetical protein|nr:CPBP family intramembrane glutamic endopeptidase [Lacipirellulaceae bacterium]